MPENVMPPIALKKRLLIIDLLSNMIVSTMQEKYVMGKLF